MRPSSAFARWTRSLNGSAVVGSAVILPFALAVRIGRRRSDRGEQLKWLVDVAAVAIVVFPTPFSLVERPGSSKRRADGDVVLGSSWRSWRCRSRSAVAILRYRLYEIDRIISRTICIRAGHRCADRPRTGRSSSLLEAPLGAITSGDTLAVALSTLVGRGPLPAAPPADPDGSSTDGSTGRGSTPSGRRRRSPAASATRSTSSTVDGGPRRDGREALGRAARRPLAARDDHGIDVTNVSQRQHLVTIPGHPTTQHEADMSELTRPIRRLFGRGDRPADVVAEPRRRRAAGRRRRAGRDPGLDRGGHRRIRPAARLPPDRARTGRAGPPRARLARGPRPSRGRGRTRRPAGLPGRADRHAQSRAAAVRAGLLDRRPSPADDPRRPGRTGHPCRPARPRAGRRGRRT